MIQFKTLFYKLQCLGGESSPRNALYPLPRPITTRLTSMSNGASVGSSKRILRRSRYTWVLGLLMMPQLLMPQLCLAEAWVFRPSIGLELGYYDNFELLLTPKGETSSTRLLVGTELSRLTDTLEVRGRLGFDAVTYTETFNDTATSTRELEDRNNYLGELSWLQKGEVSDFEMDAAFKQDSILRTVNITGFDTENLDSGIDQGDIDEAVNQQDITRRRLDVRPKWTRNLSDERTKVGFDYLFTTVDYEQVEGVNLNNYQRHGVTGRYSNRLSERTTASLNLGASLFLADGAGDRETSNANAGAGLRYAWSETLNLSLNLGARQTTVTNNNNDTSSTGFTSRIALIKNFELTRWTASLDHKLLPSGAGEEFEVDELKFSSITEISPKVDFALSARYFESSPIDGDGTDGDVNNQNNRTFFVFDTQAIWRFTPFWSLSGSYRYRQQERNVDDSSTDNLADGNSVFLTLQWSKAANLD